MLIAVYARDLPEKKSWHEAHPVLLNNRMFAICLKAGKKQDDFST